MRTSLQVCKGLLSLMFLCSNALNLPAQEPAGTISGGSSSLVTFHFNQGDSPLPIKVVSVMLDDQQVPLDTPVPVSGLWFGKVRVIVQNISGKTIVQGGIVLLLPEIKNRGTNPTPVQGVRLQLGRYPKHAFIQPDYTVRVGEHELSAIRISPGSRMTFALGNEIDAVQIQADKLIGHVSKVDITMYSFYFSDDSKWGAGKYYFAVPPPDVWREITAAEFFSDASPKR